MIWEFRYHERINELDNLWGLCSYMARYLFGQLNLLGTAQHRYS